MEKKPYHHVYKDGKLYAFRNLEGGPKRDPNFKWDWKVFREEKKKLKIDYPPEHVIDKQLVLKDLVEQKCNRKQAREIYGVIIYKNKLEIDWTNTLKIRKRMRFELDN